MENNIVKNNEQNVNNISLQDILNKHLINPIKQQFKNNKEYIDHLEKSIKELSVVNHAQNEKIAELKFQLEKEQNLWKQFIDKINSLDWEK